MNQIQKERPKGQNLKKIEHPGVTSRCAVIPARERLRQEDFCMLKASLGSIVSPYLRKQLNKYQELGGKSISERLRRMVSKLGCLALCPPLSLKAVWPCFAASVYLSVRHRVWQCTLDKIVVRSKRINICAVFITLSWTCRLSVNVVTIVIRGASFRGWPNSTFSDHHNCLRFTPWRGVTGLARDPRTLLAPAFWLTAL